MKQPLIIPLDMPQRRNFLMQTFRTAGAISLTGFLAACGSDDVTDAPPMDPPVDPMDPPVEPPVEPVPFNAFASFSPLQPADVNGVMLPQGFSSRIVATSGVAPISGKDFKWHGKPDGGACFATEEGGWVYVSNSELDGIGGASALKFDKDGKLIDAYSILKGTSGNCAGGPTPWNTWLSCEEYELPAGLGGVVWDGLAGMVWECDPFKPYSEDHPPKAWPALGRFAHEAICVDPVNRTLYMTEDASSSDGRVYRYVCDESDWPVGADRPVKFESGSLQVLSVEGLEADSDTDDAETLAFGAAPAAVNWPLAFNPEQGQASVRATMRTIAEALNTLPPPGNIFEKAEGIWYYNGVVFFVTSRNHRIWAYDTANRTLEVIFDGKRGPAEQHSINNPDNITITPFGEMLVAEDAGNLEIGVLREDGTSQAVLRLIGHDQSETTGPAVSPDGTRLYFSSQRGFDLENGDEGSTGVTFEIKLPTKAS